MCQRKTREGAIWHLSVSIEFKIIQFHQSLQYNIVKGDASIGSKGLKKSYFSNKSKKQGDSQTIWAGNSSIFLQNDNYYEKVFTSICCLDDDFGTYGSNAGQFEH